MDSPLASGTEGAPRSTLPPPGSRAWTPASPAGGRRPARATRCSPRPVPVRGARRLVARRGRRPRTRAPTRPVSTPGPRSSHLEQYALLPAERRAADHDAGSARRRRGPPARTCGRSRPGSTRMRGDGLGGELSDLREVVGSTSTARSRIARRRRGGQPRLRRPRPALPGRRAAGFVREDRLLLEAAPSRGCARPASRAGRSPAGCGR